MARHSCLNNRKTSTSKNQDSGVLFDGIAFGAMNDALLALIANLRSLIDKGVYENESAMARACGIPQRTLNRILNNEVKPNIETVEQIAKGVGKSVAEILSYEDQSSGDPDFAMIRRLDVKASQGAGNLVFHVSEKSRLAFRRDFLRSEGVKEEDAILVYGDGESMSPTIPDGAVLMVNRGAKDLVNNKIFLIWLEDEVLVKRLRKEIGGGVLVVSDNTDKHNYPDILVTPDKVDHLRIEGRVFWMGARL